MSSWALLENLLGSGCNDLLKHPQVLIEFAALGYCLPSLPECQPSSYSQRKGKSHLQHVCPLSPLLHPHTQQGAWLSPDPAMNPTLMSLPGFHYISLLVFQAAQLRYIYLTNASTPFPSSFLTLFTAMVLKIAAAAPSLAAFQTIKAEGSVALLCSQWNFFPSPFPPSEID